MADILTIIFLMLYVGIPSIAILFDYGGAVAAKRAGCRCRRNAFVHYPDPGCKYCEEISKLA